MLPDEQDWKKTSGQQGFSLGVRVIIRTKCKVAAQMLGFEHSITCISVVDADRSLAHWLSLPGDSVEFPERHLSVCVCVCVCVYMCLALRWWHPGAWIIGCVQRQAKEARLQIERNETQEEREAKMMRQRVLGPWWLCGPSPCGPGHSDATCKSIPWGSSSPPWNFYLLVSYVLHFPFLCPPFPTSATDSVLVLRNARLQSLTTEILIHWDWGAAIFRLIKK